MDAIAKRKGGSFKDGKFLGAHGETAGGHYAEQVCGAASAEIFMRLMTDHKLQPQMMLDDTTGDYKIEGGNYVGDGLQDNETAREHQWIRMRDGTIVDGSYGQFMDEVGEPSDRLMIIPPDDPRQKDWDGKYIENPFKRYPVQYYESKEAFTEPMNPLGGLVVDYFTDEELEEMSKKYLKQTKFE